MAPVKVAKMMNMIHLFEPAENPSLFPAKENIKKETRVMATPAIWKPESFSPKISTPPITTQTGCVALIGEAIVIGKCFMAK